MKTFYLEGVLSDYTDGLIVVRATNKEKAMEIILEHFGHRDEFQESSLEDRKANLSELTENELVYVFGGA